MKVVEVIRDSGCHGSGLSACLLGISNPYTIQNIFTTETLHLWFLYYLFIYQLLFYAYRKLTLKTPNYRKTNITLFILLVISQILMKSWTTTNSSSDLIIDPVSFLYYGIFFFWGSVLAKQDIDKTFNHFQGKRFIALSVALLLITPLFFLFKKLNPDSNILGLLTPVVALCSIVFSISTIGIIFNLTLRTIKSASPVISYLLDSSYWIYLWHIIPLILLQSLVNDLDYFIAAKYLFVTISSLIIMIIFYHLFARFTPIGTFLHGKRPAVTNRV